MTDMPQAPEPEQTVRPGPAARLIRARVADLTGVEVRMDPQKVRRLFDAGRIRGWQSHPRAWLEIPASEIERVAQEMAALIQGSTAESSPERSQT